MKIALLTDGIYPYVIGGMQRHSFYLAKYLAKNKVHVDLYHTNQSNYDISLLEFFSDDEKKYIQSFVVNFPHFGNLPGHYLRESYEYSRSIFDLFKKNLNVDFVYAKGFTAWKLIQEKSKGFKCAPVGVNFHGYEMFQKSPDIISSIQQQLFLRQPVLFNIKNTDYVFSYGGKITDIIKGLKIPSEKIVELPAGIDASWLMYEVKKINKKIKFLFVGRHEKRKGIDELNIALQKLIKDYDFEFHFVGNIPKTKQLQSDKIIYHGTINDSEKLKAILLNCDVLVCPSFSEGMPNVILEAMACGLAIIATDAGAVNLMVSANNGLLIKEPTSEMIVSSMNQILLMPEIKLKQMKTNSIIKVKECFIWDNIVTKTIDEISKIIK